MTERKTEFVTVGHDTAGRIRQTDRGFELFDANDRYLCTAMTLAEGRKYLFQHHKGLADAMSERR